MNDPKAISHAIAATFGAPAPGGFFAGQIKVDGVAYALIVAPRAAGDHEATEWNSKMAMVKGATSYFDGKANTEKMAVAGSALAKWALGLEIDGCKDFYLPSRDELELIYRNLKPTAGKNWTWRHGDNPSSVPVGYPYTEATPARTALKIFQKGGTEAMEPEGYWTSTQYASNASYAWIQYFAVGSQDGYLKPSSFRARAVRRLPI